MKKLLSKSGPELLSVHFWGRWRCPWIATLGENRVKGPVCENTSNTVPAFCMQLRRRFRWGVDTSLDDFPLPNMSQFMDVTFPPASQQASANQRDHDPVLPRNQLYYQYAEHHRKPPQAPYVDR